MNEGTSAERLNPMSPRVALDDADRGVSEPDAGSGPDRRSSGTVRSKHPDAFESDFVRFDTPADLPAEHLRLISNVAVLEHRSLHLFRPRSSAGNEIKAVLRNALTMAGYVVDETNTATLTRPKAIEPAVALYEHAQDTFTGLLQSRNRCVYLGGVVIGGVLLVLAALLARTFFSCLGRAFTEVAPTLIGFAGLGAFVSILSRLPALDTVRETSTLNLLVSGFARVFVASVFALVAYQLIVTKMVPVDLVPDAADESPNATRRPHGARRSYPVVHDFPPTGSKMRSTPLSPTTARTARA